MLGKCVLHVVKFVAYKMCVNKWSMLHVVQPDSTTPLGKLFDLNEIVFLATEGFSVDSLYNAGKGKFYESAS